jgi:hypothetical protein
MTTTIDAAAIRARCDAVKNETKVDGNNCDCNALKIAISAQIHECIRILAAHSIQDIPALLDAYEAERERAEAYERAIRDRGECNFCKHIYPVEIEKLCRNEFHCDKYKNGFSCWEFDMERFGGK